MIGMIELRRLKLQLRMAWLRKLRAEKKLNGLLVGHRKRTDHPWWPAYQIELSRIRDIQGQLFRSWN